MASPIKVVFGATTRRELEKNFSFVKVFFCEGMRFWVYWVFEFEWFFFATILYSIICYWISPQLSPLVDVGLTPNNVNLDILCDWLILFFSFLFLCVPNINLSQHCLFKWSFDTHLKNDQLLFYIMSSVLSAVLLCLSSQCCSIVSWWVY